VLDRKNLGNEDNRSLIEQKIKYIFEDPDAFASIYEGVYAGGRIEQYYDVTFLKKVQDQLEKQLKEKELLLREVHHRIKNNIASISSLISLQIEKYVDEVLLDAKRAMWLRMVLNELVTNAL
jgi:RNA polymerase-interacting CarD/CdnL/TRCF family regulator